MATLQELMQQNPNILLAVTKDGLDEKINRIHNVTVFMDSGNSYHRSDAGWSITRPNIDDRKLRMIEAIDAKTQEIISRGFSYDGHTFSLSVPAQANWNALVTRLLCGKLSFPYSVTTFDDIEYTLLTVQSFNDFIDAAVYGVGYPIAIGRYYKVYVKNATIHETLDVFVDPRP